MPNSSTNTKKFVGQTQRDFNAEEAMTWKIILERHKAKSHDQIYDLFHQGVQYLEITPDRIPSLKAINLKLKAKTGFEGIFVDGLEDGKSFYRLLAHRLFPVGNFIRDKKDLSYTPAPDIIHDLYGHMPFFIDEDYANFCQQFGAEACKFLNDQEKLRQFERFFWFTIEFGLIKAKEGVRVFGAGIASSTGECEYALSSIPTVVPFDIEEIRGQEFRIDIMQEKLFLLDSPKQLYSSLQAFVAGLN